MIRHVFRRWLIAIMSMALVLPPLTGVVSRALGGDGRHVHVDHVWHQNAGTYNAGTYNAGTYAAEHPAADAGQDGENDEQDCNHFHSTVMALFASTTFDISRKSRNYDPVRPTFRTGRAVAPSSRPPRHAA